MSVAGADLDTRVRLAAFEFLRQQVERSGLQLSRDVLARGFTFEGKNVPLLSPQGIFRPAVLPEIPLSITTAPPSDRKPAVYDDTIEQNGVITYRYRGSDPAHRDQTWSHCGHLQPVVQHFAKNLLLNVH